MPQVNDDDEDDGFIKNVLKKKEIKLYHKPILVDKIMLKNANINKSVISNDIKKYVGVIKSIITLLVVASVLALFYYLFSKTTVFSQIVNFFKGVY